MMDTASGSNKKPVLENTDSPFGSVEGRTRSYQEDAAVAPELRSRLETIGMRTRFNVSRGYGSPPPSQSGDRFDGQGSSLFASETQILHTVNNTRSSWNRTKSMPLYSNELIPFCGPRSSATTHLGEQDENEDPNQYHQSLAAIAGGMEGAASSSSSASMDNDVSGGIGMGDLKRSREDVLSDWANDDEEDHQTAAAMNQDSMPIDKPIAGLPKRSSPSSSATVHSPFGLRRINASTLPIGAGVASYLASAQDADWTAQDFSAFTNRSDF